MTANVINYLAERETARSNLARERETQRHNTSVERETTRHNLAMESLTREQVAAQRAATTHQATNVRLQTAAQKEAARIAAEASRYSASASASATRHRTTYDYLVGMANVAATRQRNEIQDRYNTGNLAIASSAHLESVRHNRASERLTEQGQVYDFAKHEQTLQQRRLEHEEVQWKNWNDIALKRYNAETERMDAIWRNTNRSVDLLMNSKLAGKAAGSLKQGYADWRIDNILGSFRKE